MSVLVEDAAEAVVSAYGEAGDSLGFEWLGKRAERSGRLERSGGVGVGLRTGPTA